VNLTREIPATGPLISGAWRYSPAGLAWQRWLGRAAFPVLYVIVSLGLRWQRKYRVHDLKRVRREFRELMDRNPGPILVCPNHLTMIDSVILMWAFAGPWYYLREFRRLCWNIPAVENFAHDHFRRVVTYLGKCLPLDRGGSRAHVDGVLGALTHLLRTGELCMIFPEGTRSRSGRVHVDEITYGVGRIVMAVPECRVLCVYLRGEKQKGFSDLPARGDHFTLAMRMIAPRATGSGLRAQREISRQIATELKELEDAYFAARPDPAAGAA
jgi:hypothetical protein